MQEKEIGTVGAGYFARGAAINAEMRNRELSHSYSSEQRAKAATARDLIDTAYAYSNIYINYRKTFIAIKVESARVRDKRFAKEMEDIFASQGYTKVVSDQGVVYRLPR